MNARRIKLFDISHRISGLSLVEVMVSMVIGLFLVIGATTVYVNSRKTADVDDATARLEENARYAMSVIETDVRSANYWGLAKDGASIANKPGQTGISNPSTSLVTGAVALACGATYPIDVEKYLTGSDNSYGLSCAPTSGSPVATADTLTVRRAATAVSPLSATQLQLCSGRSATNIILNSACTDEIHNLEVNTYYINQQSDNSTTVPSLRRKTLIAGPAFSDDEIVSGIEDMQVQFGWDSTGTSATAVEYVNPGNAVLTGTGQIVAVRVWLLVRAENSDGSFIDARPYYDYGARNHANGTTASLANTTQTNLGYKPNDRFRRLLVSRTFFIRNAVGT